MAATNYIINSKLKYFYIFANHLSLLEKCTVPHVKEKAKKGPYLKIPDMKVH